MMYEVTANRKIGYNEYEIEALLDAASPLQAAQLFARDWIISGSNWVPDTIIVLDMGTKHLSTFRIECNIMRQDDDS